MTKRSATPIAFFLVVWLLASKNSLAFAEDSTGATSSKSNFFQVQSFDGGPSSQRVLDLCDSLRVELVRVWSGKSGTTTWEPPCDVIVHSSRKGYREAVGPGSNATNGSSFVQIKAGVISKRRIDLLLDQHGALTSLPHELTHVILADCFEGRQPPLWLDEGIAMLADTHEKQMLHERDCLDALSSKNELPIGALVRLEQFPSSGQVAAFYGQSLSLVRMLAQQKSPEMLIGFAKDAIDKGIEAALSHHYQINDIRELETRWRLEMQTLKASTSRKPFVSISFKP